jgi:hypothetical protein
MLRVVIGYELETSRKNWKTFSRSHFIREVPCCIREN